MGLFYKVKDDENNIAENAKIEEKSCCESHNHDNESSCSCNHNHDHNHDHVHSHSHTHACGCEHEEETDVRKLLAMVAIFVVVTIAFNIPGLFESFGPSMLDTIKLVVYLVIYYAAAHDIVKNAIKNLLKGKALDEQFLMSVASIGAFFVGQYPEGCAVMLFYLVGEAFQDYAVDKSRDSISDLMDIRPDYANILRGDNTIEKVVPKEVKVGDIIVVKPGEKVPLDGVIVKGVGSLDTSALTGESLPREVEEGQDIISGSISLSGALNIKVTKEFGESTVSKILDLVENASGKKAKTEKFITRFAKIYTPIVVGLALVIAIAPPIYTALTTNADLANPAIWTDWIYRALTFLVVSCPCALVISVPLSFFAGIGAASTKGVLVKGSNYLELMSKCDTVVMDKTGTLTKGVFKVEKIVSKVNDEEFLKTAFVCEAFTNHPIGKSIKDNLNQINEDAVKNIIDNQTKISVEEIHGKGIKAIYNGDTILAGNEKLLKEFNVKYEENGEIGTIVYVAKNNEYLGYAIIADEIKETSKEAIKGLKKLGVKNTVMLTGDKKEIALKIGNELGLSNVYYELLPEDKVNKLEEIIKTSNCLAYVGDGINDAPVLARADVGIAMGAMGSDAAIEAADIVLMDDNPKGIVKAIKIAKRTLGIAKENILFALAVKVVVLVLAALGYAPMWAAVFADVGVCVVAILNAMRGSKSRA